jgi:hypothetical protein
MVVVVVVFGAPHWVYRLTFKVEVEVKVGLFVRSDFLSGDTRSNPSVGLFAGVVISAKMMMMKSSRRKMLISTTRRKKKTCLIASSGLERSCPWPSEGHRMIWVRWV